MIYICVTKMRETLLVIHQILHEIIHLICHCNSDSPNLSLNAFGNLYMIFLVSLNVEI